MGKLTNSTRRIEKATYTPIRRKESDGVEQDEEPPEQGEEVLDDIPDDDMDNVIEAPEGSKPNPSRIGRGMEKAGFLRALAVREFELARIEERLAELNDAERDASLEVLEVISSMTVGASALTGPKAAATLREIDTAGVIAFGRALADSRQDLEREVVDKVSELRETFLVERASETSIVPSVDTSAKKSDERPTSEARDEQSGSEAQDATQTESHREMSEGVDREMPGVARRDAIPRIARVFDADSGDQPPLETVVSWALTERPAKLTELYEVAESVKTRSEIDPRADLSMWLEDTARTVTGWGDWTGSVVDGFEEKMRVEPVGRLHLERLEMTPVGIERGELVYTVPLAPGETVNISHKEWAVTEEEFEEIVHDVFEEYSEEGVTEKTDLSQTTESQSRHSTAYSLSANYSQYGVSASVGYDSSSENSEAKRQSRDQSIELTRKASSRARRDHKNSFKVSSVAGTEDREVRVLSNPSDVNSMRIDYYELMRRWQVDLYRHDLRMTYDIVIPNPGADLQRKLEELRTISDLIEKPFDFPLSVTQIRRGNWASFATMYNARVPSPPEQIRWLHSHREYGNDLKKVFFDAIDVEVDSEYEIADATFEAGFNWEADDPGEASFDVSRDGPNPLIPVGNERIFYGSKLEHLHGKSGSLSVSYNGHRLKAGSVAVEFELRLKNEAFERWQFDAWDALRQGAQDAYYENRQLLSERRESLETEIEKWDALTLRKMERQEIMKGVLRWLFGPEFEFVPDDVEAFFENQDPDDPDSIDVLDPTNQSWMRIMEYGEFVKYIQQAIEWENVLYFTYPYFWDSPANWEFKRYLDHVDPRHRAFLRAGSARVVLTIRPGFERSFAELIENGAFGTLPGDHPYLTIAEEIRNYAETNYPGIPPATAEDLPGEDEVDKAERGELIGRWYEYTPTSALDISVDRDLADMDG